MPNREIAQENLKLLGFIKAQSEQVIGALGLALREKQKLRDELRLAAYQMQKVLDRIEREAPRQ